MMSLLRRLKGVGVGEWVLSTIIVVFVLLAGTGLFYNFGLPIVVAGEVTPLPAALKMIAEHTLRPAYPTFIYLPVAAYAMFPFVALGVLTLPLFGVPASIEAIREFGILHYGQLLPWIRLASVFYGALAIAMLYLLTRRLFGRREIALFAAFFLATSLLVFQLAHFGKVWILQLLMVIVSLLLTLKLFEEPTRRRYLWAAVGVALSFGINTIGALAYVPFVVAHALKHKGESFVKKFFMHRDFLLAHALLFGLVLLFYHLNPYGYENYLSYIKSFFSVAATSSGLEQIVSGENTMYCDSPGLMTALTYYPLILIEYEFPIVSLSILGLIFCWRKIMEKRDQAIILGSFGLAYFFGITAITVLGINPCQARYIVPVVPVLALLSAVAVTRAREVAGKRLSVAILIATILVGLCGPIMFDLRLMLPSTRIMVREWIFANIPNDARVVTLDETLELPENEATLRDIQAYAPYFVTKKRAYLLNALPKEYSPIHYYVLTPTYFRGNIPDQLAGEHYDYLVVSWWNPTDRAKQLSHIEKLGLPETMERIARFPDTATDETESMDLPDEMRDPFFKLPQLRQNGPVVDVYRIR